MLSDACSEFLSQFDQAATTLAEVARWYASADTIGEYRDQTYALLQACTRVREAPYDDEARVELLRLTMSVVRSYDA